MAAQRVRDLLDLLKKAPSKKSDELTKDRTDARMGTRVIIAMRKDLVTL